MEALKVAISRIGDADMAKEMMNFTREQLLMQASSFVMAQANTGTRQTLSFLQSILG